MGLEQCSVQAHAVKLFRVWRKCPHHQFRNLRFFNPGPRGAVPSGNVHSISSENLRFLQKVPEFPVRAHDHGLARTVLLLLY